MKNKEQFVKKWEWKRQKGKLRYVLTNAGVSAGCGLAGTIIGSIFLYDSPSVYSFSKYLPVYLFVFVGVLFIAALTFSYKWNKNEGKFAE